MRSVARVVSVVLVVSAVTLAAPAVAGAALSITSMSAAPAAPQAGQHANFSLALGLSGSDHAKSLVIHLPAGLIGNPEAATPCSEATFNARGCATSGPGSSKVGVSSISAVATSMGVPTDITASGSVFVLQPREGEIARLGIDLYPDGSAALLSPHAILNQSVISVRTKSDNGLDSTLEGLPKTSQTTLGEADVHLTGLNLTLSGQGGKGPFMSNPTSCHPATTTVDIVSYESPDPVSRSAEFTPTECDKLAFAPKVSLTATGDLAKGGRPALKVGVTQADGQAAGKRVKVELPAAVTDELFHSDRQICSVRQQASGQPCPAASKIGTAVAATPILPVPLTGDVHLLATAGGLPSLQITLQPLGITVVGIITSDKGRIVNTFDNLPDTPLSNFELNLNGGTEGIIASTVDLCSGPPALADGTFLGHNGATTTQSSPLKAVGCKGGPATTAGKPTLAAAIRKVGTKRATLAVKVKAGRNAPKLRRVRVTLPSGVSVRSLTKQVLAFSPKGLKVKKIRRNVIEVRTVSSMGVVSIGVTLKAGSLTTTRKAKKRVKVVVYDVEGKATMLSRKAAK